MNPFQLTSTLNTFIGNSIQVDMLSGGPGDANVVVGNDPADGTASANLPAGGPGSYIDWDSLGGDLGNHRILDVDDASGKDPTAFPQSNECVASAQVLSKMDLTYVGAASNSSFAYLAVQRSANSGDAGYYWLFTHTEPHLIAGQAPCSADKQRLLYDLVPGDILLAGHFKPNGSPLLRFFRATGSAPNTTAVQAVNYLSPIWMEDPAGVAAVAVNTTIMAPGSFGSAGVKSMKGANLDTELFAEAAIPLSVFLGGSTCGASLYGSVITRSSGSGGTSPDLKDLAGPALFNFGTTEITARMTPTCGLSAGYELLTATGADGSPIGSPDCDWQFDDGSSSSDCSGLHAFGAGPHTGTLTVTDPTSGCSDTFTTAAVDVYEPLSVSADLTATCALSFGYSATVQGGSPAGFSYSWAFSGSGGTPTPATSNSASGSVAVDTGNVSYTGSVTVTDLRTDVSCTAGGSDSATPYAPLSVNLVPTTAAPTCPTMNGTGDDVTYAAVASGGDGAYGYTWLDGACSGASCTVDPDDGTFCAGPIDVQVTLNDGSGLCGAAASEVETYTKVTTVTTTNNP